MDYKQLLSDLARFNFSSFVTRSHKLMAVLKRKFILSNSNYATTRDYKEIPIIINNRNRLTYLSQMVEWLLACGYSNIIILDNKSNYQPLLDYYKKSNLKVIYLKENLGHLALWKSGVYKEYYKDYYVYTDPDLLPVEGCPDDFVKKFITLVNKYSSIEKVGFGLKIDDLPDCYDKKEHVIKWEKKFWETEVEKEVYSAPLDTTFALYKPYTNGEIWVQNALRTGGLYVLRHLPWYEDSTKITNENLFYMQNLKKGASHWIEKR